MSNEKMREEFESGVCDLLGLNKNWSEKLGRYTNPKTDNYFVIFENGWLRSRDALCVELPRIGVLHHTTTYCAPDVRSALDSAGVRYK